MQLLGNGMAINTFSQSAKDAECVGMGGGRMGVRGWVLGGGERGGSTGVTSAKKMHAWHLLEGVCVAGIKLTSVRM